MSLNTTDFVDAWIATLKAAPFNRDFSSITYDDENGDEQTIEVEQTTRDLMAAMAQDLWHQTAVEVITTSVTLDMSTGTTYDRNQVVLVDAAAGDRTITLPTPVDNVGKMVKVKRTDSSGNIVTVSGDIDEGTSHVIYDGYGSQTFVCDGTEWWTLDSRSIVQRGSQSFSAQATAAVVFADPMPSTNYRVTVEPNGNPLGGVWITSKSTSGFTINFASSVTLTANWEARI